MLFRSWKAACLHASFLNYDEMEKFKDFGGIRIEDDILITKDGSRFLGKERIPVTVKEIEAFMRNN